MPNNHLYKEWMLAAALLSLLADNATAQANFTVLKSFTGSDGANPEASLTLSGSTLYGTTANGGSSNYRTVFKVNTDGTSFTLLKDFTNSGGGTHPSASLTLSDSTLYGTTYSGGTSDRGTVFRIDTDGTGFTVLKSFTGSNGAYPKASLTLSESTLYGTTYQGAVRVLERCSR